MTEEEYRTDLLAASASRAEVQACSMREAFMTEVLERLREAGEVPDTEPCPEAIAGQRSRRLEIDAFAFDEADSFNKPIRCNGRWQRGGAGPGDAY
jgi:hypothetical protein